MPNQESLGHAIAASRLSGIALLVDDDIEVRDAMGDLVACEGLRVNVAGDGLEALELLRAGLRPSVIVLDLIMPRMDGRDFRQAQKADRDLKDIPVIVVSAGGFRAETFRREFRDVQWFEKPFEPVTFLRAIGQCCQSGRRPPIH